jgi:diaminopimelate decarboxylase
MSEAFKERAFHLHAMKANQSGRLRPRQIWSRMDVVSEGELRRALAAGVPYRKIVFPRSKTAREMALA